MDKWSFYTKLSVYLIGAILIAYAMNKYQITDLQALIKTTGDALKGLVPAHK